VNSAGVSQGSQSYDVYGAQSSGGTPPGGFGFAGEQWDSSTGLQYLRARYYDPTIGRFISRDPMSAIPGWTGSPYGYGGGNPVNVTDPTGLCGGWLSALCGATPSNVLGAFGRAEQNVGASTGFLGGILRNVGLWAARGLMEYVSDPQTWASYAVLASGLAAGAACSADALSGGQAQDACSGALIVFGAAVLLRYNMLQDSGMSTAEIACQIGTDLASLAPGGGALVEATLNAITQQIIGDSTCSLVT
jgi:RHS repeat-associated protein